MRWFIGVQIAVPSVVLGWRVRYGAFPWYGWGWEMFT